MFDKQKVIDMLQNIDEARKEVVIPLVERYAKINDELDKLERLPFIRVNPKNDSQQKATPAYKMYKDFLQQQNNIAKTICAVFKGGEDDEISPLEEYFKNARNRNN